MKRTFINLFLFATGAAVGSLVTWKIVKTKYERILQEEIDSVKETWERLNGGDSNDVTEDVDVEEYADDEESDPEEDEMLGYTKLASKYTSTSDKEEEGGGDDGEEVPYINGPYVIEPSDYGNGNYDHSLYCLTYYYDGILANDWWETFDIEETIGQESLEHFGDYVDDVVHVRNERLNADYEVVRDPRNYTDLIASDPLRYAYAN